MSARSTAACVTCAVTALLLVAPARRATTQDAFTGSWVMAQLATSAARVPILGEVQAQSRLVTVHRLRHEGGRLQGVGTLCRLELDSGSWFVRIRMPPATQARLPPPRVDARVGRDARGQWRFRQDKQLVVVGARLADPLLDPLPRRAGDPRVVDEDRDGQPGLTIEVGGIAPGRLYVAQRSWTELSGTGAGDQAFAGSLRFGNEQVVLRASSSRLARAPMSRPVPERSWFRLQRLSGSPDCAAARAAAAPWFE
jgi:hypothetical protein